MSEEDLGLSCERLIDHLRDRLEDARSAAEEKGGKDLALSLSFKERAEECYAFNKLLELCELLTARAEECSRNHPLPTFVPKGGGRLLN